MTGQGREEAIVKIGALEGGGTKMVCAVGNERGEILNRISIPTETPEITMPKIREYFRREQVEALGIGCFGPLQLDRRAANYGCITTTPKLAWAGYPIVTDLKEALGVVVGFDTDVNGSALGELTWGCAKGLNSCVYMTVGTGIGVGVVVNGRVVHGMMHPEAGHMLIRRHPEDSFAGHCPYHKDCLEGMAAGPAIEERWGQKAILLADRREVWELEAYYLAQAIANMILVLSPEKVILGGGVMHQEHVMPSIRRQVLELLHGYIKASQMEHLEDYIVLPSLNDDQGIMGCIRIALDELGAAPVTD